MKKRSWRMAALAGVGMATASLPAAAHVEYYDLNQGRQIGDLTAAGKIASTAQYGATPAGVVALGGVAANGLASISAQVDMPLNNTALWNGTYQSYTGVGSFSNLSYSALTGSGSATVNVNDVTDFGWANGTKATLGDSHKVDFFNFRLATKQVVTISWNVDFEGTFIDGAFSLYRGVLNYQGHDDANEKLNPKVGLSTKVQDALDQQNAPGDVQGISSSYRNTTSTGPGTYLGQFNALANWGESNVSGNWSNVAFLASANARTTADGTSSHSADTLETLTLTLDPGNYTIAASGALGASAAAGGRADVSSFGLTNLHGELTFKAVAVPVPVPAPIPEPETWAMMLSGIALVSRLARRHGHVRS